MYLILEKLDIEGSEDEEVEVDITFTLARYFKAKPDLLYTFDAEKADDLRIKMRFDPGTKALKNYLKMFAIRQSQKGYLNGYAKYHVEDDSSDEQLPDKENNDFTLMEFSEDFWGHVVDSSNHLAKKKCFSNREGCTIYLNLELKDGAQDIEFGTNWVKGIERIYNDLESVSSPLFR